MNTNLRPAAVPLVTVDPYFNVWSMTDKLMHDHTRHWTTTINGMVGMIKIDGTVWRYMGRLNYGNRPFETKKEGDGMEQKSVVVSPLTSTYIFEAAGIRLEVKFTTPLFLDNLDLLSRPASYIGFTVNSTDGKDHEVQLYFDASAEWCVNTRDQKVIWGRKEVGEKLNVMYMGNAEQNILNASGDDIRIDWGYFYMAVPSDNRVAYFIKPCSVREEYLKTGAVTTNDDEDMPRPVENSMPVMGAIMDLGTIGSQPTKRLVTLAYDDIYSIEYFGKQLMAYWKRNGATIEDIITRAVDEYDTIITECIKFDEDLIKKGIEVGGQKYADLLCLSYRQSIAAQKLVLDGEGNILFLSKENFSNGCMGTTDVSYPSIPLYLIYNPELVEGMIRPIFKYARMEEWVFDFAPHDIGTYPLARGQSYSRVNGKLVPDWQMPVEECGNMMIMTAATALAKGSIDMAYENRDLLEKWVKYLIEKGQDPGEQLCTDDFAGKLAHNTNLSIKAIIGVGCYSLLLKLMGQEEESDIYMQKARDMAKTWEEMAFEGDHYKLAFHSQNNWSLKYNLVWDKLMGLNLFTDKVREREAAWYLKKQNRYGTPLDSRRAFTKSDWLVWAASLADSKEDFIKLIEPLWDFVNETPIRMPFTDFYGTLDGLEREFHNRSVIGGLFIRLLRI